MPTDLPSFLAYLSCVLAVVVWTAVLVLWLRRRPRHVRPIAPDEPSGPIVPAGDLLPAVWIPQVDRRHPEPYWIGTRHHVARRPGDQREVVAS